MCIRDSYYTLQRYNAALRQRNALLKPDAKADMNAVRQQLYIWDEQLSKTGAEIMRMRAEFVQRLGLIASRLHRQISGEREALLVRYAPDVDIERMGGGDAEAALSEALYNGALDDIRRGYKMCIRDRGHIPSGVPYIGFARNDIMAGKINRVMIIGKGSLFLGRMTNLFDGVSFVIEANKGEKAEAGVSEDEVKKMIAKAMREFAASRMGQDE